MDDPKPTPLPPPQEGSETGTPPPAPPASDPFAALMVTPEEAAELAKRTPAVQPEEASPEEDPVLLTEVVEKICGAIDRLARKGLNFRAVVALLHDANPTIPKKQIKAILESLRELPAIYGRTENDPGTRGSRTK